MILAILRILTVDLFAELVRTVMDHIAQAVFRVKTRKYPRWH